MQALPRASRLTLPTGAQFCCMPGGMRIERSIAIACVTLAAMEPSSSTARAEADAERAWRVQPAEVALLASVFVVAACGLLYELAAGALASYLLGDSVLQFSTIIGAYLFAMGVGSFLSRYVERQLVATFLRVELLVGL